MRSARRLALSLALAVTAAIFMSGTAFAASPGLVISQVYGAGGNADALYANDYIELFNRGATDVVLYGSPFSTRAPPVPATWGRARVS